MARYNGNVAGQTIDASGAGQDFGTLVYDTGIIPPISAVSRKTQGSDIFDINLPLTGSTGIECRTGGSTGGHEMIVRFATPVT